jgi:hypothetical protein
VSTHSTGRCQLFLAGSLPFLTLMAFPAGHTRGAEPAALAAPAADVVQHVSWDLPAAAQRGKPGQWQLCEVAKPGKPLPALVCPAVADDGQPAASRWRLLATIPPGVPANAPRRFELRPRDSAPAAESGAFRFAALNERSLKLLEGDKPVWAYNHGEITNERVPAKDARRTRACYLHPVWGLNGEVLTDDFPKDHYHHHGIFWAWPHVSIDGKEYDLWVSGNIRQKFVRWLHQDAGPAAAVLAFENGWFVGDRQVMTERIWVHTYPSQSDERSLDLTMVFIPGDKPVTLRGSEGKSYGGLTVRFDAAPRRDATVRAPGHKVQQAGGGLASTQDLADMPLPWADLTTHIPGAPVRSGAAIFVSPDHPDYPPSWLTRCYGPLCIGWPGVKARTIAAGKPFTLRYRVWIHKTEVEEARLQHVYDAYCKSPRR